MGNSPRSAVERESFVLGVDVGGTFTDAFCSWTDGRSTSAKVLTDPDAQSSSVIQAVASVLDGDNDVVASCERLVHGTTVATNALLERKGARTAFVGTRGFKDVLFLARQARPHLYDLVQQPHSPIVAPDLCFDVDERCSRDGVLRPLDVGSVLDVAGELERANVDSVAICLLFSFMYPDHERAVARILGERLPDKVVISSHDLAPEFREYERAATTAIDAYVGPSTRKYLGVLGRMCHERGLPQPAIMQSSGGMASLGEASAHASRLVLSGPAGGLAGAQAIGEELGVRDFVTLDMGGTSTDIGVIHEGTIQRAGELHIGGLPIRLPSVQLETIGAGGGSIAWRDGGGALRVGPESAGAIPGPACYSLGGIRPTVTDANLVLGYLAEDTEISGVRLDLRAARHAMTRIQEGFDSLEAAAAGVVDVANVEMARSIRVVTVQRGLEPTDFYLLAFGGAGPLHAVALAAELGFPGVIVPLGAGVLSAIGLAVSEQRVERAETVLASLDRIDGSDLRRAVDRVRERTLSSSAITPSSVEIMCDVRYRGQAHELQVPHAVGEGPSILIERLKDAHLAAYGFAPEEPAELVAIRVTARRESNSTLNTSNQPSFVDGNRQVWWRDGWIRAAKIRGAGSNVISGPAVIELATASAFVPPGWAGRPARGALIIERI